MLGLCARTSLLAALTATHLATASPTAPADTAQEWLLPVIHVVEADPDKQPAESAPPADEDTLDLPAMTVVGSRTRRAAQDVPGSVSVLSARDLEYTQASNLSEALSALPGVAVEGGPRANGAFLNIRGLSGPRVLLVVDGARQNFLGGHRSSLLVDPEMLKQVELLRGPASALWGSDALGGVVVLTTKDAADFLNPGERLAARTRFGFESVSGEETASGIVAGRLGSFDAVFNAVSRQADNFERGDGLEEPHTGIGVDSHVARLSWLPEGSAHSLRLIRQSFVQDSVSPSNPSIRITDTNPLIDRTNDATYSVARYGFEPGGDGWLHGAQFNVYRDALNIREDRVDDPRADRTQFQTDGLNGHLTIARSLWSGAADSLLTLGIDAFDDQSEATRNGQARAQFPDADRSLRGYFAQAEIPLGRFSLVPGLRIDRYTAESNQDDSDDIDERQTSPKLGLLWAPLDGIRVRASYDRAFRAPGLVEVYAAGQHFLGNNFTPNPQLRPETARNLELGFTLDRPGYAPGHQWLIAASAYENRVNDYIELFVTVDTQVPAPQCLAPQPPAGCVNTNEDGSLNPAAPPIFIGGQTSSRNLPSATLRGGEVELAYAIGPYKLGTSFSRVRGNYDVTGEPLLTIPADRIRTTFDWTPTPRLHSTLGLTRRFATDRVPTFTDDDGNEQPVIPPTESSSTWDFALSWEPLGAAGRAFGLVAPRLVAGIDNLTDEDYRTHLNTLPSPGRNVRVSLSAGF